MLLTDEDIQEFIATWRDEFHEELAVDTARGMANQLMQFYVAPAEGPTLWTVHYFRGF